MQERRSGKIAAELYADPMIEAITLYKLLNTIDNYVDDKLWISVYEEGIMKGIQPRNSLENRYQKLKKNS